MLSGVVKKTYITVIPHHLEKISEDRSVLDKTGTTACSVSASSVLEIYTVLYVEKSVIIEPEFQIRRVVKADGTCSYIRVCRLSCFGKL